MTQTGLGLVPTLTLNAIKMLTSVWMCEKIRRLGSEGGTCLWLACAYLYEDVIVCLSNKTLTILENPNQAQDGLSAAKKCTQGCPGM